MNGPEDDDIDHGHYATRQRRALASLKEQREASAEKLRQVIRLQNQLVLRLFPLFPAGRDTLRISQLIKDKKEELDQLEQAVHSQQAGFGIDGGTREVVADEHASLAQLKRKISNVRGNLEDLQCQLSPVKRLPVEVLGDIFLLCTKQDRQCINQMTFEAAPLALTHVCSSWRAIATSKPELWSSLDISILAASPLDLKHSGLVSLVQLWITRSCSCPLSFSIENEVKGNLSSPVFFAIVNSFIPQIHRWQVVKFQYVELQDEGRVWFPSLPDDATFPLLEGFILEAEEMSDTESDKIATILRRSPRLRSIRWNIKADETLRQFPFEQLTSLELGGLISLRQTLFILSTAKDLCYVDVCVYMRDEGDADYRPITHSKIQIAHLAYTGNVPLLFPSLTLPGVVDLVINQVPPLLPDGLAASPWPQQDFMDFLKRSKCALHSMALLDIEITPDDLHTILRHVSPSLVEFKIESMEPVSVTDQVLRALTYPSQPPSIPSVDNIEASTRDSKQPLSSILCPRLKKIRLSGCIDSLDGVLADMVESRCHPPPHEPPLARLEAGSFGVYGPQLRMDQVLLIKLSESEDLDLDLSIEYIELEDSGNSEWSD